MMSVRRAKAVSTIEHAWPWAYWCVAGLLVACSSPSNPLTIDVDAGAGKPVGASCTLVEEQRRNFAGLGPEETNIETGSAQCASHVCVAHHFQGRATCPYGQTADDIQNLAADSPRRCRVANEGGSIGTDTVIPPVRAQLVARRAADVVICTCRCAGNDPNARYCTCPAEMTCAPIIPNLGFTDQQDFEGSYCIKPGTEYDSSAPPGAECSATSTDPTTDCGNGRANP